MRSKMVVEELVCRLTDTEKRERGEKIGILIGAIDSLKIELALHSKGVKDEIARLDAEKSELALALRQGVERRPVDVQILPAVDLPGMVVYRRMDTGEVYRTRAMNEEERQSSLLDEAGG